MFTAMDEVPTCGNGPVPCLKQRRMNGAGTMHTTEEQDPCKAARRGKAASGSGKGRSTGRELEVPAEKKNSNGKAQATGNQRPASKKFWECGISYRMRAMVGKMYFLRVLL